MARGGFKAECQDCPTLDDLDYGGVIRNGVMSWTGSTQAQVEVMGWAQQHVREEPTHRVKVNHYMTLDFDATEMDHDLWRAITGG